MGVGCYDEVWCCYIFDVFVIFCDGFVEWCIVYLGVDLFVFVGMFVYMLYDGYVWSVVDNEGCFDYGFIIIFYYIFLVGLEFWILYGYFDCVFIDGIEFG